MIIKVSPDEKTYVGLFLLLLGLLLTVSRSGSYLVGFATCLSISDLAGDRFLTTTS